MTTDVKVERKAFDNIHVTFKGETISIVNNGKNEYSVLLPDIFEVMWDDRELGYQGISMYKVKELLKKEQELETLKYAFRILKGDTE
jgi:hypothetical protein